MLLLYSVSWAVVTRVNDTTDGALDTSTTTLLPGSILNAVGRDERKRSAALSAKN